MSQPHNELIARYEQGITALEDAMRSVPEELLDRAPSAGKWTIRQIMAHLADSELVVSGRLRWIAAEPGSPLKAFDQDKWASTLGYEHQSPQDSLELFRALRKTTAAMLRRLPEDAWKRTGVHEERGEMTLAQMVESYQGHAEHHARQICSIRGQLGAAA
jgi:DinB superfamily